MLREGTGTMSSLVKTIETVLDQEHKSVWGFCSAIEDSGKYQEDSRTVAMIAQGLRQWSSYRESARKEYESLIKRAEEQIKKIDSNFDLFDRYMDTDRVNGYNAKADTQVEIVRTACYIIGVNNETLGKLFATVTTLQFSK